MRLYLKNKKTLSNINKLYNERSNAIKFSEDFCSMILKAKRKAGEEEPLKVKIKRKKSPLELHEEFLNKIESDKKNINEQIFNKFFSRLHYFLPKKNYVMAIKLEMIKF